MANLQAFFDHHENNPLPPPGMGSDASSDTGGGGSNVSLEDAVSDGKPARYIPPHRRKCHLELGENVVVYEGNDDPDMLQGALNSKFQRLLLNVNFVLLGAKLKWLNKQLPGIHFHCSGHRNHDHPISHVVTMWGTRQLQRMIPAGSTILDVGGNPAACDSFNASQQRGDANRRKSMKALVSNHGGQDFIREVTKWGPIMDADGEERYFRGTVKRFEREQGLAGWNVFQMIHTLYYHSVEDVMRMVHAQKGSMVLALIHVHPGESGFLHDGEQSYEKRRGIIKQRNVLTGTSYTHPDIAPFYFKEKKEFWGVGESEDRGISWECHFVCENTWIIQIVAARKSDVETEDVTDFEALWEGTETTLSVVDSDYLPEGDLVEYIKAPDGTAIPLYLTSPDLYDRLKVVATGRARDQRLYQELLKHAKTLTTKSAIMPDQQVIDCEPHRLIDHVAAVYCDLERENDIMKAVVGLRSCMAEYNENVRGGGIFRNATLNTLLNYTRNAISAAQTVNRICKTEDKIGRGLDALAQATRDKDG